MPNKDDGLHLAYVTQLRSEHRQMKQCLLRVEQQWQRCGPRSTADIDDLISSLTDLRAELAYHFAKEEAGGCLEAAVSHSPWLGREAAKLEREDSDLLQQFDRLIHQVRTAPNSINETEKEFRQFVEQLCQHEAMESRIVQRSFGIDVD